jgi:hypothetical protein
METLKKIIQKRLKELKQNSHMSKIITLCRTFTIGQIKKKKKLHIYLEGALLQLDNTQKWLLLLIFHNHECAG